VELNVSDIADLQLFSAIIFPANDPEIIIKETPTYDKGNPYLRTLFKYKIGYLRKTSLNVS